MTIKIKYYLICIAPHRLRIKDIIFAMCYTPFNGTMFKQILLPQTSASLERKIHDI